MFVDLFLIKNVIKHFMTRIYSAVGFCCDLDTIKESWVKGQTQGTYSRSSFGR